MSEWYYRIGDQEYGPLPAGDLRKKIESGELSSSTQVFRNGLSDWLEAGRCRELTSEATAGNQNDIPEPQRGTASGRKSAPFFRRPWKAPDLQSWSRVPSRNRILYWFLGIIFAGVLAGVLLKVAGSHPASGFARYSLPSFQAADSSHPSLGRTRNYWLALRKIAKPANEGLKKMQPGEYPLNAGNELDFTHFTMADFEKLKAYKLGKAQIAGGVTMEIETLPKAGVDPALLHYELELWEVWSLIERANLDYAKITRDLQEQRACFATPEGYALRFGKPLAGPSEIETRRAEDQKQINEKITEWKALTKRTMVATENLSKREAEVKKLLSLRYGWEFN